MIAREKLIGKVPMPEVFGWTEDGGQRFIYVSLIEGETLQERWCDMNDDDRRTSGPNPKVTAIIDWGQAGWCPAYWEYCKARRVRVDPEYFDDAVQEEWYTKYLPMILDPEDDETYYYPWL
ncbi:hypothetical protein N7452_002035 [Penicillium brevicompactum]|uniref:Aminoglycoside phosphotransferase domain-containing protein n=1 Tax=Penicillium brevicompactum TaxID=5074 RepID=A0A9W9R3U7_PENBR|nr:hypothetical protein N7452_002035 [Penicillium brevicompactum]